ncbi:SurA N-terminal domain-containing protein [Streptomyces sp. E11-3]|uniref:SurA N-terminal domain-containing protein n=1 Tax=Streptomyces sp. E11-3 TaxID=3110112 RepID=UPI00397EF912
MHRRSRTALSVSAALLIAAPLLAACGNEAHPGAAAVVGGERITVAQLEGRVNELRDAQRAVTENDEQYAQLLSEQCDAALKMETPQPCDPVRGTLHTMVFERVVDRVAKDAGIEVTRKELQTARAQQEKVSGGAEGLERTALRNNVAPARLDDTLRTWMLLDKLDRTLGGEELRKAMAEASDELSIDLNPRYGTWDVKVGHLGEADTPWLREVTPRLRADQQA